HLQQRMRELGINGKNTRAALEQRQPCQQGLRVIMGEQQHAVTRLHTLLMKPCGQIVDAGAELLPAQHLVVETQSRCISTLLAPVPPRPVAKTHCNGSSASTPAHGSVLPGHGRMSWVCIRFNVSSPGMVSGVNQAAMRANCV